MPFDESQGVRLLCISSTSGFLVALPFFGDPDDVLEVEGENTLPRMVGPGRGGDVTDGGANGHKLLSCIRAVPSLKLIASLAFAGRSVERAHTEARFPSFLNTGPGILSIRRVDGEARLIGA